MLRVLFAFCGEVSVSRFVRSQPRRRETPRPRFVAHPSSRVAPPTGTDELLHHFLPHARATFRAAGQGPVPLLHLHQPGLLVVDGPMHQCTSHHPSRLLHLIVRRCNSRHFEGDDAALGDREVNPSESRGNRREETSRPRILGTQPRRRHSVQIATHQLHTALAEEALPSSHDPGLLPARIPRILDWNEAPRRRLRRGHIEDREQRRFSAWSSLNPVKRRSSGVE